MNGTEPEPDSSEFADADAPDALEALRVGNVVVFGRNLDKLVPNLRVVAGSMMVATPLS